MFPKGHKHSGARKAESDRLGAFGKPNERRGELLAIRALKFFTVEVVGASKSSLRTAAPTSDVKPVGRVRCLSCFYFAVPQAQVGHVLRQMGLLFSGGEQPQFGPAPQNILCFQCPFLTAQVVNFAAV